MSSINVAFWNLQNFFDTDISDIAADLEFTPEHGWDHEAYQAKKQNLAEIVRLMHNGAMPDLLGICEIENEKVVLDFLGAIGRDDYDVAHVESTDVRGIDTSLIYSTNVFELIEPAPRGHVVHMRFKTRDIFEVNLRVKHTGADLTVLVNHWPSRSRGQYESEPYRIAVAMHCGRLVDSLLKFDRTTTLSLPDTEASLDKMNRQWNRNVLLMGDFNDEPFNRSILDELKAANGIDKIEEPIKKSRGRETPTTESYLREQAYLFNCMWPLYAAPDHGTHYYSSQTNTMNLLDQFIISRGLYFGEQGLLFDRNSVEIFRPEKLCSGWKKRPDAFDKRAKTGYSDHFPILARLDLV